MDDLLGYGDKRAGRDERPRPLALSDTRKKVFTNLHFVTIMGSCVKKGSSLICDDSLSLLSLDKREKQIGIAWAKCHQDGKGFDDWLPQKIYTLLHTIILVTLKYRHDLNLFRHRIRREFMLEDYRKLRTPHDKTYISLASFLTVIY